MKQEKVSKEVKSEDYFGDSEEPDDSKAESREKIIKDCENGTSTNRHKTLGQNDKDESSGMAKNNEPDENAESDDNAPVDYGDVQALNPKSKMFSVIGILICKIFNSIFAM